MHEPRERLGALRPAVEGVGDEPTDLLEAEGGQYDVLHGGPGLAKRPQRLHQRMRGTDLVVPVRADQQERPHLGPADEVCEQRQGRGVQPLQIVEEEGERVLGSSEHADESTEDQLKAVLRVLRRELRNGRLLADEELHLRDEVHDQLAVRAQRLADGVAPAGDLGVARAQDVAHEALECLGQSGVRDVLRILVELPGREEAPRRDEHFVELVDHRGFADTGEPGDEHQPGGALSDDALEGSHQRFDLALAPVQPLRDDQTVRRVLGAQREGLDAACRLPGQKTPPKVNRETGGRLVATLGGLGEELHHDRGQAARDALDPLVGRDRLPGDMAVDPLHRISGRERQHPREHLVEGNAQRIEIAAGVDRAVHSPGLFRCHVGERSGDHFGRLWSSMLSRQTRSNAEPGEPCALASRVHQDIRWLDVLVDDASLMHLADRGHEWNGDAQELRHPERHAQEAIERLAPRVFEHQRHPPPAGGECQRPRGPVGIERGPEFVFVLEPPNGLACGVFRRRSDNQDWRHTVAGASVEGEFAFPLGREHVVGELRHEALSQARQGGMGRVCHRR